MEARSAEVYITSANGVSKTGELVNIDGTGNRVSQTLFGPEKVYFVIGNNKVCPDLTSAMERAKQIAHRRTQPVCRSRPRVRKRASAWTATARHGFAIRS